MSETDVDAPSAQPLFYRSLERLDAAEHAALRLAGGTFDFAAASPSIPIVASEFADAARHYPIVFAANGGTPLAVLGLDHRNVFVKDGAWAPDLYIPAYVRRYPFGYLRLGDTTRYLLGIDLECDHLVREGGEPLFEEGRPAAITERALNFCEIFRSDAEATLAFVRALEGRDLLVDRRADAILPDGRNMQVDGFQVVDAERYAALDAPTLAEWHARGWLSLVAMHLASLNRFQDIVRRRSAMEANVAAAAPDPAVAAE